MTPTEPTTPAETPNESRTPRTDGIFRVLEITWYPDTDYEHFVAAKGGARWGVEQLETDLARANAENAALQRASREFHAAYWNFVTARASYDEDADDKDALAQKVAEASCRLADADEALKALLP